LTRSVQRSLFIVMPQDTTVTQRPIVT